MLAMQIIRDVQSMVVERLRAWKLKNGRLPKNILYYRDGISGGQYDSVKSVEVAAIHRAFKKVSTSKSAKVNVTAVVVTKRHHTRFFPMSQRDGREYRKKKEGEEKEGYADRDPRGNYNTKPGTTVDRLVTSPYYQDFFLQSHSGIKGTVKPIHYFVLEDGIPNFALEDLRRLVS